jgi:hypothetical protein
MYCAHAMAALAHKFTPEQCHNRSTGGFAAMGVSLAQINSGQLL